MGSQSSGQEAEVRRLALRQLADYRSHDPGTLFSDPGLAMTMAEAYGIQVSVAARRRADGEGWAGFKLGCTGPRVQAQLGLKGPVSGFLFDSELHRSGVRLTMADFSHLAVEAELGTVLGDDLEPAAIFPVIELHNHVLRSAPPRLEELVANNGLHAGVVLPDSLDGWTHDASLLSLTVNGRLIESVQIDPIVHAGAARAWLGDHLSRLGLALSPGQLILTGTPLSLVDLRAGDSIRVSFESGAVEATVDAPPELSPP